MRIRRRIKRTTKQYITVAIICIVVIGGAAIFTSLVLTGQIRQEYEEMLRKAQQELKENQRNVFVATSDIRAGDFISSENMDQRTVFSSQPEETYITSEDIGKIAIVDIPSGTQIQDSMLTDSTVSSRLRELEYNVINISSNVASDDIVDVRIFYPNGESYVVLSKKALKGFVPETASCYFWMDEEELLRMSAAIVDAGLYSGSKLFVTKYIEPSIQEASVITYTPSLSILSLIEQDPNIVDRYSQELNKDVRKALENRLAISLDNDVRSISWDINDNASFVPERPSQTNPVIVTKETDNSALSTAGGNENERIKTEMKDNSELGDASTLYESDVDTVEDFFFYVQEDEAKAGIIEYGE